MSFNHNTRFGLKAQILRDQQDVPIQLVMPAETASALAFIASDFAREVVPNSDEARRLIALAEMISNRLLDCLAARSPDQMSERPALRVAAG